MSVSNIRTNSRGVGVLEKKRVTDDLELIENSRYFSEIDRKFKNIQKLDDDHFYFKSEDTNVLEFFECPIPVTIIGSLIDYKFSTEFGDINFGIVFESSETDAMEVLHEMKRLPSDSESIEGCLEILALGTVFLMWDNSHSWSSKKLKYSVELYQPTFTSIDNERVLKSYPDFRKLVDKKPKILKRINRNFRIIEKLTPDVQVAMQFY